MAINIPGAAYDRQDQVQDAQEPAPKDRLTELEEKVEAMQIDQAAVVRTARRAQHQSISMPVIYAGVALLGYFGSRFIIGKFSSHEEAPAAAE